VAGGGKALVCDWILYGGFLKWGSPIAGGFIMENPIEMGYEHGNMMGISWEYYGILQYELQ